MSNEIVIKSTGKEVESSQKRYERYQEAKSRMDHWTGLLENAYRLTIPNRDEFTVQDNTPGNSKADDIFDMTAPMAVQTFANNIQTILMPPFRRWAKLVPGIEVPENEKAAVEEKLQVVTDILFKFIDRSNFAQSVNESLQDLAVGTGVMVMNEGTMDDPFSFISIPISHVAFEAGANNRLENFWRRMEMPARQIERLWPKATLSPTLDHTVKNSPNVRVTLIEGTIFYPKNSEGSQYFYYVQEEGSKNDIFFEFRTFSPWIGFRYSVSPGEIVGRGPVLTALPTIRVVNKMVEYILRSAKLRAFPIYLSDSSSDINPYNLVLEPGSVISVNLAGGGIQPLPVAGDPQFAALQIQDEREMIRQILFADPLPPQSDPTKTATEISIRMQTWTRQAAAFFGRFTVEFLEPVLQKELMVLTRKGLIEDIKVDGKKIKIQYESPLLDLQSQDDIQRAQQWIQNMQVVYGQFAVLGLSSIYPTWSAEKMNVDLKLPESQQTINAFVDSLKEEVKKQLVDQATGAPAAAPAEAPPVPPFLGGGQSS